MPAKTYNLWVTVERATDVRGQWVAHVLDFDAVTQGNTIEHALRMAGEAAAMIAVEDLGTHRDPTDRRAPEEDWERMFAILRTAELISVAEIATREAELACVVCTFELEVHQVPQPGEPKVPVAWSGARRLSDPSMHCA